MTNNHCCFTAEFSFSILDGLQTACVLCTRSLLGSVRTSLRVGRNFIIWPLGVAICIVKVLRSDFYISINVNLYIVAYNNVNEVIQICWFTKKITKVIYSRYFIDFN